MTTGFSGPQGAQPKNITGADYMPRAQLPKRTGLLKVRIGTRHQIAAKKGKKPGESIDVIDMGQWPEAKMSARCLTCQKDFKTEKELVANHPTAKEMKEAGETHLWGYWSEDKEDPTDPSSKILGLLSDLALTET